MTQNRRYVVLQKEVGQTPLECVENWRKTQDNMEDVPLAYAGRLDPMASGSLLILIGEECKNQTEYHNLDKEYEFSVLFGVSSDSGDVLGIAKEGGRKTVSEEEIKNEIPKLIGKIELPYPIFSSKTVQGKPLHTWAMENRLDEIEIPTKQSEIYELSLQKTITLSRQEIVEQILEKIELIPPVTDMRKALGNDFRRPDIRKAWNDFLNNREKSDIFTIATFRCICSSGTYMRTLAEVIARELDTTGLAYSIHRTNIGKYKKDTNGWDKLF
jgi:tRNA pseudouridine(55) synthase